MQIKAAGTAISHPANIRVAGTNILAIQLQGRTELAYITEYGCPIEGITVPHNGINKIVKAC
jgi:hypothetical protein